jgi:hypothetical protein
MVQYISIVCTRNSQYNRLHKITTIQSFQSARLSVQSSDKHLSIYRFISLVDDMLLWCLNS